MIRIVLIALTIVLSPAAWAQPFNQFVAGLPSANPLSGADLLYVVQGGISKNTTAAALAASFPSLSLANPTASIGLVPINGSASTAMRSDAAPAINLAIIPTWSGLHTFGAGLVGAVNGVNVTGTPSAGYIPVATGSAAASWINFLGTANSWTALQTFTGIAINPTAASTNQGFNIAQSGPTSGTTSATINYNNIFVNGDNHNNANNVSNGLNVEYGFGGPNFQGAIQGLNVYTHLNTTGNASNPNPFYTAINAHFEAFGPDTSSSAIVTLNSFTLLQSGATGYHSIEGIEVAAGMVSSGGAAFRVGENIAAIGSFQGASGDAALVIGASGSPWVDGFLFSHSFNGAAPLDATNGCIICTDGSSDTIKTGIDASSYTITGNFLKGPNGFVVPGNGTVGTGGFLISGLPTCNGGTQGLRAFVTNGATSPAFLGTVSATGAVIAPVFCNGTAWIYG